MKGKFIISLDYELMWGVRDKRTIESYGENVSAVPQVIDKLLSCFSSFNVQATFATVGFLFAKDKEELIRYLPQVKPNYDDKNLNPFIGYIDSIGDNSSDHYHYAIDSIHKIKKDGKHEISTHTFSHYYCLEKGQNEKSFLEDVNSAKAIAEKEGINIKSIVFPRNQYNPSYDKILLDNKINIYRGNEKSWFYSSKNGEEETLIRRMMRLIDTYVNISGNHCFSVSNNVSEELHNIPSSRFLRPYNPRLKMFEDLRLNRIKKSMTYAAKKGLCYHLWWHPHNFGSHQNENFLFLTKILNHYKYLNEKFGFQSCTMENSIY